MAPEQTGRMNRSIDSRSDLYAYGVTLYEMLTGTLPFTATDPMEKWPTASVDSESFRYLKLRGANTLGAQRQTIIPAKLVLS
jgi:serine/threonine protein kinase